MAGVNLLRLNVSLESFNWKIHNECWQWNLGSSLREKWIQKLSMCVCHFKQSIHVTDLLGWNLLLWHAPRMPPMVGGWSERHIFCCVTCCILVPPISQVVVVVCTFEFGGQIFCVFFWCCKLAWKRPNLCVFFSYQGSRLKQPLKEGQWIRFFANFRNFGSKLRNLKF